jgi:UDP-N-acetylglucosamine 4,6-dehydratase/5-epimerase
MKGDGAYSSTLKGQSIVVLGGSGSFGQSFVRRALSVGASRVVVFSRSEAKQAQMKAEFNDSRLRFVIGDVRDANRVMDACRGVDIVVHAAALKRVEVCEMDPAEAVATNVIGTMNVARACIERGVKKAVLLSTDKAAAPNTLYGSTKLAAERLWNSSNVYSAGTPTRFACTRYGNVLGSTGSVIPIWRSQIPSGEITITDPRMTRFFMSMDAAVDLVCLALSEMRGGEVFVPMIPSTSIMELAEAVAPNCRIRAVGIRPGEKMHETLITEDESRNTHDCGSHYVIEPDSRTWGSVPPLPYPKVADGFVYRSDTASAIPPAELVELAA